MPKPTDDIIGFDPTKPKVETPEHVPYLEGEMAMMAQRIKDRYATVKAILDQADELVKLAREEANRLKEGPEFQASEREVKRLADDLGHSLDTLELEAKYVFSQLDNTIFALERKDVPGKVKAEDKLTFVLDKLKETDGKISQAVKTSLAAFVKKMVAADTVIKKTVRMFDKPKKTAQADDPTSVIIDAFRGAYADISDLIHEFFTIGQDIKNLTDYAMSL